MRSVNALFYSLFAVWVAGSACGHELKYKVDERIIADLPLSEKQGLMAAQTERAQAMEEQQKARADMVTDDRDIFKADADYQQARLGVRKVQEDLKLANPRQDVALLQQLHEELQVAKTAESAARLMLVWCKQRRTIHQAQVDVAIAHLRLADARYEQEKARLAAQEGRLPSTKFPPSAYDQQVAAKQQRYEEARRAAAQQEEIAVALERSYNREFAQYSALRSQTPSFNPTFAPPGYTPPPPPGSNVGSRQPNQF
jgi:hypothetical protein